MVPISRAHPYTPPPRALPHLTYQLSPPLDAREPLTRGTPVDKFLSRGISELRNPSAEADHPYRLSPAIPQPRDPRLLNLSTEEFLRVVSLAATIHFSPFTRSFRRFCGRLFMGFFCSENAKFTQSLLCSLFAKFTGERNHSHVHALCTATGSIECSSIHVSVGD